MLLREVKSLAKQQAEAHDCRAIMLTQADEAASGFYSNHKFREGKPARTLVERLRDWQAEENPVYVGSTPMAVKKL